MSDDKQVPEFGTLREDDTQNRREFLLAAKGWSMAIVAAVALGTLLPLLAANQRGMVGLGEMMRDKSGFGGGL